MTGRQEYDRTKDRQRILDEYYLRLVGFGRACAHPSFWAHAAPNGALRAPPPIAASLLFIHTPKIKIIHRTRAARVKGFFLSTLPPRPESIQSATASIQSSELVPPACKRVLLPPFGSKGGDARTFGGGGGGK
jgi:hypothetical protein